MTSYHHPYPSTQVSSLGFGAMQPYRARASDFWYKLAWLFVGLLALLGTAFSLYRNGVLLKLARDCGAEQTYISFERSLLGGPYWGTPSFELPMPAVAELGPFAAAVAAPTPRSAPSDVTPSTPTTTHQSADSELVPTPTQEQESSLTRGTTGARDSSAPRAAVERSLDKGHNEAAETKPPRLETAKSVPSRPSSAKSAETGSSRSIAQAAQKEFASSKPHEVATAPKESLPSKRSVADTSASKRATDSSATLHTAETSNPVAASISKPAPAPAPAPARKTNPLDAAIRAAIGK